MDSSIYVVLCAQERVLAVDSTVHTPGDDPSRKAGPHPLFHPLQGDGDCIDHQEMASCHNEKTDGQQPTTQQAPTLPPSLNAHLVLLNFRWYVRKNYKFIFFKNKN
uniref:Uncharacterized protein n=1 Tax=Oryza meridionalis TaxID=40149 RepID=A0A0E0FDB6_9ORYZ